MIKFNNTEDAIKYGILIKGNDILIGELKIQRELYLREVKRLNDEGKESEAFYLASGQSQFTREAIEQSQKERIKENV